MGGGAWEERGHRVRVSRRWNGNGGTEELVVLRGGVGRDGDGVDRGARAMFWQEAWPGGVAPTNQVPRGSGGGKAGDGRGGQGQRGSVGCDAEIAGGRDAEGGVEE